MVWTVSGRDARNAPFLVETAANETGGNGLVLLAHRGRPVEDFVLKSNLRHKHTVSSDVLQAYLGKHASMVTVVPSPDTLVLDSNGVVQVLHDDTQHALYAVDNYIFGHAPCVDRVQQLLREATTATVVARGPVFSQMVAATRTQISALPWATVRCTRKGAEYTVETVGPAPPQVPAPLVVQKTKPRPAMMAALNGPGILPNAVRTDLAGNDWLVMPLAAGGTLGRMHDVGRTPLPLETVFGVLCRAALTCLTQTPPRFMGDAKPENIVINPGPGEGCKVIDVDWVPDWKTCIEFGGPRHWATFQPGKQTELSAVYERNPTLMVLHSILVTTAALASRDNMQWAYRHAVHQCDDRPATTRDTLLAMPTAYPLKPRLLAMADRVDKLLTVEGLVALLQNAAAPPAVTAKRKRSF